MCGRFSPAACSCFGSRMHRGRLGCSGLSVFGWPGSWNRNRWVGGCSCGINRITWLRSDLGLRSLLGRSDSDSSCVADSLCSRCLDSGGLKRRIGNKRSSGASYARQGWESFWDGSRRVRAATGPSSDRGRGIKGNSQRSWALVRWFGSNAFISMGL